MNADRVGAIAVAAGPLILLVGILWHPFIPDLRVAADVVRHLDAEPVAWFGAHLLVALGTAVLLLGFLAVRAHVRTTVGREPWTGRAIAPLVVGSVLFSMLPAMEIGMLAVERAGGDLLATQNELNRWFQPLVLVAGVVIGMGTILFAVGIHKANILPAGLSWLVVAALLASAVSRAPFTAALMAGIVALNVAMLPLAFTMWKAGSAARPAGLAA